MIYFICPYPASRAPSQRFRFEQYLKSISTQCTQVGFWSASEWPEIYKSGSFLKKVVQTVRAFIRRFIFLFKLKKASKIFIHREATPIGLPWFEWVAAKIFRKELIYDFDDAIWLPNSSKANAKLVGKLKSHSKVKTICKLAKTVVVGNEFLATYARQFCDDVRIIPTTIDTEHLHNPSLHTKSDIEIPVVGWTGTHSTLQQLIPIFETLEKVHKHTLFKLLIISDLCPDYMPDFAEFRPWNKENEIRDLMSFDIGIMPLFDTDWERGKCAFKALQYMALKIPAVISAVGMNKEVLENGVQGFLAEPLPVQNPQKWENTLTTLLKDKDLRLKMGKAGRQNVIDKYSVLSQKDAYSRLFEPVAN